MFRGKSVAVVVPCFNEETQIEKTINSMPAYVDRIFVVDDKSTDRTVETIKRIAAENPKVLPIVRSQNGGVGTAIANGYQAALREKIELTVVMAGDGQMDPLDLGDVLSPVADNLVDYCKGNRFLYLSGIQRIPVVRLFGNFVLSALTKIVTGYWHISDSQCGYTAINLRALESIDLDKIYPRYGCPNDILNKLNIAEMRVGEVPVNPLYGVGEMSKMRIHRVALPILGLLMRLFGERLLKKYVFRTGHPLVMVYLFAAIFFVINILVGIHVASVYFTTGVLPKAALIIGGTGLIVMLQLLLKAFEMDFDFNQPLQVDLKVHWRHKERAVHEPVPDLS